MALFLLLLKSTTSQDRLSKLSDREDYSPLLTDMVPWWWITGDWTVEKKEKDYTQQLEAMVQIPVNQRGTIRSTTQHMSLFTWAVWRMTTTR